MKKGKLTDREKRLLEKGYKKKKDGILFFKEFELREIADLLVTDPEDVPLNYLPWTDISKEMKESKTVGESTGSIRSYDDCKNEWKNIIYPILSQTSSRDKRDDIKLLKMIIECEYDSDTEIDFSVVENDRDEAQNKTRWSFLLRKFGISKNLKKTYKRAEKLLEMIKTKRKTNPKQKEKKKPPHLQIGIGKFYKNVLIQ